MSIVRSVTRAMSRAAAAMNVANTARTDAAAAADAAAASAAAAQTASSTPPTVPNSTISSAVASYMQAHPVSAGKDGKDGTNGAASTVPGPAGTIGLINVGEVILPALTLNGTTTIVITWATPFANTDYKLAPWLSAGLLLGTNVTITNTTKAVDKVTYTVKGLGITLAGTFRVLAYA